MKRPGRRSVPSLLWALTTNSAPLSRPTSGVATRQTRRPARTRRIRVAGASPGGVGAGRGACAGVVPPCRLR